MCQPSCLSSSTHPTPKTSDGNSTSPSISGHTFLRPSRPTNYPSSKITFWRALRRCGPSFRPPTSSAVISTTAKPTSLCASTFSMMVRPSFAFSWRMKGSKPSFRRNPATACSPPPWPCTTKTRCDAALDRPCDSPGDEAAKSRDRGNAST
jgi:hypothetical protein